MKRIDVAIAIIVRKNQILIARRRSTDPLGGYWEFPGGKCAPGESPAQCLVRETREELAIDVVPVHPFPLIEHDYPHAHVRLHPFLCRHVRGEPTALACEAVQWVPVEQLCDYRFPPANDQLLTQVIQHLALRSRRDAPSRRP